MTNMFYTLITKHNESGGVFMYHSLMYYSRVCYNERCYNEQFFQYNHDVT